MARTTSSRLSRRTIYVTGMLHAPAVGALKAALAEHKPSVVITSSWTRFMSRERCDEVLRACGIAELADALDGNWEAPQATRDTRYAAIQAWLHRHGPVDSFAVVDDERSGTGLGRSDWDACGGLCGVVSEWA